MLLSHTLLIPRRRTCTFCMIGSSSSSSLRQSVLFLWASSSSSSSSSSRVVMSTSVMNPSSSSRGIAAIAQLRSTSDKWKNLLDIATCARMAKEQGASMLFLPECFGFMGESSIQTLEQAEDPIEKHQEQQKEAAKGDDHPSNPKDLTKQLQLVISGRMDSTTDTTQRGYDGHRIYLLDGLQTIAKRSGLWISGGGMHVLGAPSDPETGNQRVYNTHIILDDEGNIQAIYQKIHLFDVSIPGKVQLRESATTAPGTKLVVCDSPLGKLGLSTCYDMRFPEMYIPLVEAGAQILLMPSAFTVPTGAAHWHTLLKARAIESQCYVIASAQYGRHNEKRESFGHSLAVDPWGRILVDAGGYPIDGVLEEDDRQSVQDPPSIVTCEIDLDTVSSIRQRMPLRQHREDSTFSF